MEWSQEGIVTGLREQDTAAVRDWVTRYTPSIQRVGMSYLNDNDQAAKLTKAVFSQALATIQTGFTPTDMEGWLLGMAFPTGPCHPCRTLAPPGGAYGAPACASIQLHPLAAG